MKIKSVITGLVLAAITAVNSSAQIVVYTFGSTSSPVVTPNSVASNIGASAFSGSLGAPGTGGSSPLSSGAYFTATTWSGSEPGSNYFEFTLTPNAGYKFSTTAISFDYRVTSTGPATLAIRSSSNSYSTSLGSITTTKDSVWYSSGLVATGLNNLTSATSFRIYGFGASSNSGTLRVDNVTLNGTVSAIPEPSAFALLSGMFVVGLAAVRRRSRCV